MSYAKALAAIEAYAPKRLCKRYYTTAAGAHCAIGAAVPATRRIKQVYGIAWLCLDRPTIAAALERVGLSALDAEELQSVNDTFEGTPRQRYSHVRGWLRAVVKAEQAVATAPVPS